MSSGPAAFAHTELERSDPVDGATLGHPPKRVTLWFTEPLRLEPSSFSIMSLDGRSVRPTAIREAGSQGNIVVIELPLLDRDVYSVSWRVLSATDTHVTTGLLLFGVHEEVGSSVATRGRLDQPVDGFGVGLRWLDILGLATLIGSLLVTPWVLSEGKEQLADLRSSAERTALKLATLSAAVALIVGFVLLGWQADQIRSSFPGKGSHWGSATALLLFQGRWAFLWWARQGVLVALLVLTIRLLRSSRRSAPTAVSVLGGLMIAVIALLRASGGHAASLPSGVPVAVLVDAAHFLAAGVWIGGLVSLSVATFPRLRVPGGGDLIAAAWKRFGIIGGLSVGVLAATGLYEAGRQVASPDAALRTTYGVALLGKVILGLVVGAIGLANWAILRPRVTRRIRRVLRWPDRNSIGGAPAVHGLRRLIALEASFGVIGLLVLAALMGSSAPARGPGFVRRDPVPSSSVTQVNDLLIKLSVKPNVPGENLLSIAPVSTRRPSPGMVTEVKVKVVSADGGTARFDLVPAGDDGFRLGWDVDRPGLVSIEARVERDGLPDVTGRFTWVVEDGSPATPPVYSTRPLGPILTRAAVVVLFVTGMGAGWVWRARRRTRLSAGATDEPISVVARAIVAPLEAFPDEAPADRLGPPAFSGARRGGS